MPDDQNRTWLPIALIAGALTVWGSLLALGAFLAPVGDKARSDYGKLWVVAATTGGFLLFWGFILAVRGAKHGHPGATEDRNESPDRGESAKS